MSEGRQLVSDFNSGFHWGLGPGVVFSNSKVGFEISASVGYGFDTGSVIVVPGLTLKAYFLDPNVYMGLPNVRLVFPIDRFAPFIEGGIGLGYVDSGGGASGQTGLALETGAGFMVHFSRSFALGAEVNYQAITSTSFSAVGVGPILAFAF
jgi:Outer membrane protein beta-barrel domain